MRSSARPVALLATIVALLLAPFPARRAIGQTVLIDPKLIEMTADGKRADAYVRLRGFPDLAPAAALPTRAAKTRAVFDALTTFSDRDQAAVRAQLLARGLVFQVVWIDNALRVADIDRLTLDALRALPEIELIEPDAQRAAPAAPPVVLAAPRKTPLDWPPPPLRELTGWLAAHPALPRAADLAWGVTAVHAPEAWARGATGRGIVIADLDTGVFRDHEAIDQGYRGAGNGALSDQFSWFDAVDWSETPVDEVSHGTHTVGTLVGRAEGHAVGVAPDARWIACRNMAGRSGVGAVSLYAQCFQFAMAPTDTLGDHPDPTRAADITSNSWSCDSATEPGCNRSGALDRSVRAMTAAGIMVVVAAGNSGASCSTVGQEPGSLSSALTIGGVDRSGKVGNYSSRGPAKPNGASKPDLVAPGSDVPSAATGARNAYRPGTGTSMATPHVAGVIALLWSAQPWLRGNVAETIAILEATARPVRGEERCGGLEVDARPNLSAGYGLVDANAALDEAEALAVTAEPAAGGAVSVRLANRSAEARRNITITDANGTRLGGVDVLDPGQGTELSVSASVSLLRVSYLGRAGARVFALTLPRP